MRLILDPAVRLYAGGRVLAARGRIIRLAEGGPAALRALLADTATPAQRRLGERLIDAGFAHPRPAPKTVDVTVVIPVKDGPILPEVDERTIVVDDGSVVPDRGRGATRDVRRAGRGAQHRARRCDARSSSRSWTPTRSRRRTGSSGSRGTSTIRAWRRSRRASGPRTGAAHRSTWARTASSRTCRARRCIVRTPVRFDETLRYGEDVDLIWRLLDQGHRVVYDPSVVVLHHEADVLRRRFRYGTSAAPLAARHPTRLRHVVLARPRPLALARVLHEQGRPAPGRARLDRAVARAVARGATNLVSPYGIGVLWGKIGGLPTILGPRIS